MSRFLALPGELRNAIYEHAAVSITFVTLHEGIAIPHALMRTCRTTRLEFSPIFQDLVLPTVPHFKATVRDFSFGKLIGFIAQHPSRDTEQCRTLEITLKVETMSLYDRKQFDEWFEFCQFRCVTGPRTSDNQYPSVSRMCNTDWFMEYVVELKHELHCSADYCHRVFARLFRTNYDMAWAVRRHHEQWPADYRKPAMAHFEALGLRYRYENILWTTRSRCRRSRRSLDYEEEEDELVDYRQEKRRKLDMRSRHHLDPAHDHDGSETMIEGMLSRMMDYMDIECYEDGRYMDVKESPFPPKQATSIRKRIADSRGD